MLTSHTLNIRRQQRGITLIEVSIGLIIAAIIAAAAFIAFQNNSRRSEVRDNIQQLTEMISEAKQKFGKSNQFNGLTTQTAIASAVIPPNLALGDLAASNSYEGPIEFTPNGVASVDILWGGVPEEQCLDLVVGLQTAALQVTIDGEPTFDGAVLPVVDPTTGNVTTEGVPGGFNVETATAACTGNDTEIVDIVFAIGRN